MMDLAYIQQQAREAAREATQKGTLPLIVEKGDVEHWKRAGARLPFPYTGTKRFKGWKLVRTLFCDSSGFGREGEPALTKAALLKTLKEGYGYAILEIRQFQVRLGEFSQL